MNYFVLTLVFVIQSVIFASTLNSNNLQKFKDDGDNSTDAECDTCLAGMDLVHYILSDPYWVDTYLIAAKQLCESIPPGSLRNTCLTYVNEYLLLALKVMANSVRPESICKALQACNSTTNSLTHRTGFGDNILCEECRSGFILLQSFITDHQQIRNIKSSLKIFCLLFAENESKCNKILGEYSNEIITYFEKHKMEDVCYKLCTFINLLKYPFA
uniref:Saposin-like,IPR008139 Saposin B,domain-containing protein n=1 Tax=Schistosoma japonicum TaxID=6182 RepID=C1L9H3_SCHJA|nr:Saposin-like,IPR008139 Saposin B,domain-containing protein [Schistosoma japonicum]